jgi:hypothetical protein
VSTRRRGSSPPVLEPEFDFDGYLPVRVFDEKDSKKIPSVSGEQSKDTEVSQQHKADEARWQDDGGGEQ